MSVNVLRSSSSYEDLRRILAYFLDHDEPMVGSRFADCFEETLTFIADFPELGIPWESVKASSREYRVKPVRGFENYLVFYRISDDGVRVLRIFHGHQDIENLL
jgi:toxin ParE1/3/4